jgi:type I restriction enzyme S subunit
MATKDDNALPLGWVRATIGDLIAADGLFVDGDWVESKDQDPNGDVRLIQLADVGDGEYRHKSNRFMTSTKAKKLGCTYLKPRDILIARMPDPLGRSCLFPGDSKPSVTVVDVCIVRTGNVGANHGWLMHAINSPLFRANIASLQSGSTRKRISRGNLATLDVPVPPLPEQHRIVAKIEELLTRLDAGVKALNAVKAQLKRYRQSVLKSAFEGKLTAEWREAHKHELEPASVLLERIKEERKKKLGSKYKEFPPLDTTELPELPEGWMWVRLGVLLDDVSYGTAKKCDYKVKGLPVLRIPNVANGFIDQTHLKFAQFTDDEIKHYALKENDLLIIRSNGSVSLVGKSALVTAKEEGLLFAGYLIRLRLTRNGFNSKYLNLVLSTPLLREQIETKAKSTSGVNNVNSDELRSLVIPLCSENEQNEIVLEIERCFSVADAIERSVIQSLAQSERLRQSILKRAFEGKLVPQDPNDPPASELLERIRSEREKATRESEERNKKRTTAGK